MAKKVPCTNEDKQKSFYKFYAQDIYAGEQEKYDPERISGSERCFKN